MFICVECAVVAHNKRTGWEDFLQQAPMTHLNFGDSNIVKSNQRLAKDETRRSAKMFQHCGNGNAEADLPRTRWQGGREPPAGTSL